MKSVRREERPSMAEPSPAPLREWKNILLATFYATGENHLSLLAAGVAFYMLFALVPALGAAAWLLGLWYDPAALRNEAGYLRGVLPQEALDLIQQQLAVAISRLAGLSVAGVTNLAIALFTARTAAASMIEALNTICKVEETRGIIRINAIAILFTLLAIATMLLAIAAIVVAPGIFSLAGLHYSTEFTIRYLRWPVLAAMAALALATAYRYGPDRKDGRWSWMSWGSIAAISLWLAGSISFSWYVAEFNSYNRVYGSLGAVMVVLFWFWLTAFAGLLGAQLDKQIEEQMRARLP